MTPKEQIKAAYARIYDEYDELPSKLCKFIVEEAAKKGVNVAVRMEVRFRKDFSATGKKRQSLADYMVYLVGTDKKVAIEREGGIWSGGRHTRPQGYLNDMEKYNAYAKHGIPLLRYPFDAVADTITVKKMKFYKFRPDPIIITDILTVLSCS